MGTIDSRYAGPSSSIDTSPGTPSRVYANRNLGTPGKRISGEFWQIPEPQLFRAVMTIEDGWIFYIQKSKGGDIGCQNGVSMTWSMQVVVFRC